MAALTPIPTRGGPHPRASLLLRLETPEQLGCAQLHPQGALLLAGADNGDVLLFATSSGGLVQVCWEGRQVVMRRARPPAKALWPATAAGAATHPPAGPSPLARSLACLPACSALRSPPNPHPPSPAWPGPSWTAWNVSSLATRAATCACGTWSALQVGGWVGGRQAVAASSGAHAHQWPVPAIASSWLLLRPNDFCRIAADPTLPALPRPAHLAVPCAVVTTLVAHRADVAALACMAPLGLLATGSADTNIKLWDLLPGSDNVGRSTASGRSSGGGNSGGSTHQMIREARQVLKGHSARLTQLRFTPDGELLISGDAAGGLRVWHVAGGAAGRLLHNLSGTHTAAITGIACHPEERLFATCSLDRTLRVWDLDGAQAGRCIGVHGPEGRREARALAFTGARAGGASGGGAGGAVLLAAYADGLRTFGPDPLLHHDTTDLPWSKVRVGNVGWQGVGGLAGWALRTASRPQHALLHNVPPFVCQDTSSGASHKLPSQNCLISWGPCLVCAVPACPPAWYYRWPPSTTLTAS